MRSAKHCCKHVIVLQSERTGILRNPLAPFLNNSLTFFNAPSSLLNDCIASGNALQMLIEKKTFGKMAEDKKKMGIETWKTVDGRRKTIIGKRKMVEGIWKTAEGQSAA
jgi:hypothetical protein